MIYRKKRVKPRMESQETPASSDTPTKPNTQRLPPPLEYYFLPRYSHQCIMELILLLKEKIKFYSQNI